MRSTLPQVFTMAGVRFVLKPPPKIETTVLQYWCATRVRESRQTCYRGFLTLSLRLNPKGSAWALPSRKRLLRAMEEHYPLRGMVIEARSSRLGYRSLIEPFSEPFGRSNLKTD